MNAETFKQNFTAEDSTDKESLENVLTIIEDVKRNKDEALRKYTAQFDGRKIEEFKVPVEKLKSSFDNLSKQEQNSLILIKERIADYQQSIKYKDFEDGEFSYVYHPLERIGIYIPGGTALYPSSVLMTAVPAAAAGVENIVAVTPTFTEGNITFAALYLAGVTEVYTVGGAQAIAALAYGTESIKKVDKIVGPGNKYVALAKKQVFGDVGIDMIAGPSEILLYVDESADYTAIAYDIFAQAEHDVNARTFLLSDNQDVVDGIQSEVDRLIDTQVRADVIRESLKNNHYQITDTQEALIEVINFIAPEHVSIQHTDQQAISRKIRYAGAVFIGKYSPEAIGDYAAGPSHVLPTNQTGRFSHGLNVNDFLTSHAVINLKEGTYNNIAHAAKTIAKKEGLDAHYESLNIRTER
ncbi:histidinol dehydrogenase [Jeotgalicoccus coquinae]|uniref:Histidinol dehydrogenase n=1 Tax=Jeotgalicoccus coquinae TaxID=709509 RepID=A0A6V7R3K2_9STAP|nr:histidinol dehydrogenase [Jeotgalicoccus coquinae]MBB6423494.1 histidinol dehydrogenase [Jeotgalicoccus coquinae]GGE20261.1 histidinol dehydrogenase [Jeotgalicoccus coquinae]CAD2071608.1 Histidinol dehydrogenase [Jeotgalicoccus coquinae]